MRQFGAEPLTILVTHRRCCNPLRVWSNPIPKRSLRNSHGTFPALATLMSQESAAASPSGVVLPAFEDGLGRRYRPAPRGDQTPPEILCFRHDLTDVPSFEFSLRERVARL